MDKLGRAKIRRFVVPWNRRPEVDETLAVVFDLAYVNLRMECVGLWIRTYEEEGDDPSLGAGLSLRPLRSTDMHNMPFASLLERARQEWRLDPAFFDDRANAVRLWSEGRAKSPRSAGKSPEQHLGRGRPPRHTMDDLRKVAGVYTTAYWNSAGTPQPTAAVMSELGYSRSVATKLVMRCRKVGLLGLAERGKAGGLAVIPEQVPEDGTPR